MIGSLKNIVKSDFLVGIGAATSATQYIANNPIYTLLAGAGIAVPTVAINIAEVLLNRAEIKNSYKEIAFINEVKENLQQ